MALFVSMVLNSRTGSLISRFYGNSKNEVEILAREKLFNFDGSKIKSRCYKVFEKKTWPVRKLKNCFYRGKFYKNIFLRLFTDWDGSIKINVNCDGANMNDYNSVKEAFSHIKKIESF